MRCVSALQSTAAPGSFTRAQTTAESRSEASQRPDASARRRAYPSIPQRCRRERALGEVLDQPGLAHLTTWDRRVSPFVNYSLPNLLVQDHPDKEGERVFGEEPVGPDVA